jgi:hypothetical protein
MGRFSDALLHLEIARHQIVLNGDHKQATACLLDIIRAMYNDGNIQGAKLMVEEKTAEIRGFLLQRRICDDIQEEGLGLGFTNSGGLILYLKRPGILNNAEETSDDVGQDNLAVSVKS